MIVKRVSLIVFALISLASFPSIAADREGLSIMKVGTNFEIRNDKKVLLRISGANRDEGFIAGQCAIIRRNVRPTELFPDVDKLECFQLNGDSKIYLEKDLDIRRLDGTRVLTSPDQSWAVIPDEEEGMIFGFFLVSSDCVLKQIDFPRAGTILWGTSLKTQFIDKSTLLCPDLTLDSSNGQVKKIKIIISKDGSFTITDV